MSPPTAPSFLAVVLACVLPCAAAPEPAAPPATQPATQPAVREADVARAVEDLKGNDWIIQYRAIRQLTRWQARSAAGELQAVLAGKAHPWVRGRALVALAQMFGERMLDEALAFARDGKPELRAAAIEALGVIGLPRGEAAAAAALKDPAAQVRYHAILAAARLRKAKAWPLVKGLLADPDAKLVRHVAEALKAVGTDEAHDALVSLLSHADENVRLQAVESLGAFARAADIKPLLERMAEDKSTVVRHKTADVLAAYAAEALRPHILAALNADDGDRRVASVSLLAKKPDVATCDAVAAIVRARHKDIQHVMADILACLSRVDAARYRALCVACLGDSYSSVRRQAIWGIARCADPPPWPTLKPLLSDESSSIRTYVVEAVAAETTGSPPGGMIRYLAGALQCKSWDTSKRAVLLIVERATPAELSEALDVLEPLLAGDSGYVRSLAAKTLDKIADEPTRRRIAAAQGYVTDWQVFGPLPNDEENAALARRYEPEIALGPTKPSPAVGLRGGSVFTATDGKATKAALLIAPPAEGGPGKTVVTYAVDLPQAKALKLTGAASLVARQGKAGPVKLSILAGGKLACERTASGADANSFSVDLAAFAGGRVRLDLVAESTRDANSGTLRIAGPKILADGSAAADLAQLAPTAFARTEWKGAAPAQIEWQPYRIAGASGFLAFHDFYPPPTNYKVAYAYAELTSPSERDAFLEIDCDDGCVVWCNGKEVYREAETKAGKVKVTLRRGTNRLLVKVANLLEWWRCSVRVADEKGRGIQAVRAGT